MGKIKDKAISSSIPNTFDFSKNANNDTELKC